MPLLHYVSTRQVFMQSHPSVVVVVSTTDELVFSLFSQPLLSPSLSPPLIPVTKLFNHCNVSLYNVGLHSKKQMGDGHV